MLTTQSGHGSNGPHTWAVVPDDTGGRVAVCRVCGHRELAEAWIEQQHLDMTVGNQYPQEGSTDA